jgi:hypothetical protein
VFFSVAESSVNLSTGRLAKSPKRLVFPKSIFRFRCFFSIYDRQGRYMLVKSPMRLVFSLHNRAKSPQSFFLFLGFRYL